jgi:hypothetical protein
MGFIPDYFKPEKYEALLFILISAALIAFSSYAILKFGDSFYEGLAIPFILIALVQIVIGSTVFFRTDKQISTLKTLYKEHPKTFDEQELSRIIPVNKNFIIYRNIELAFVVIGLGLFFILREKDFWYGIGVGMFIQGAVMLSLDMFAERRGHIYQNQLKAIASEHSNGDALVNVSHPESDSMV